MQLSLFGLLLLTQPLNSSEQDTRANLEFSSNFGPRLSLRELFVRYAGGQRISLNQSDKWLKQSDVIDNWNVTTTDTAIAFRKISRFEI